MKISSIFQLNKTQHELDFVDIDPAKDKSVFIDPFFLSTRQHPWCFDASRTVRSFFQYTIDLINANKLDEARGVFRNLNEPNETCFGMSRATPQGRGVGNDDSGRIFDSILESKAVQTGLVEDLEDTAIFIDNIGKDKVSDMTTNIIKRHLIEYTKNQCELWNIPLEQDVPSGFYWDAAQKKWDNNFFNRLIIDNRPILLTPKIAVSFYRDYIDKNYYQHYVLNYLQGEHLAKNSGLVQERTLKDGSKKRFVTKKDIIKEEAPFTKEFLREFTRKHPEVFKNFRANKSQAVSPIKNDELEDAGISDLIDYLITSLRSMATGGDEAANYHKLMIGVLELILYPRITNPVKEREINEGRKRIDIVFDNAATHGFFYGLHDVDKILSRYIFVECKNYADDPKNPEIDQLAGRFSAMTSNFGILVCRTIENKNLFIKRCGDLWKQKQELILPLTDEDVIDILNKIKDGQLCSEEKLFLDMKRNIILS